MMEHHEIIKNLFTDKYTIDEKYICMANLELKNPPLLDELIKKHQPLFWSEVPMNTITYNENYLGYEVHTMKFTLGSSLKRYENDKTYNPEYDFDITKDLEKYLKHKK